MEGGGRRAGARQLGMRNVSIWMLADVGESLGKAENELSTEATESTEIWKRLSQSRQERKEMKKQEIGQITTKRRAPARLCLSHHPPPKDITILSANSPT